MKTRDRIKFDKVYLQIYLTDFTYDDKVLE